MGMLAEHDKVKVGHLPRFLIVEEVADLLRCKRTIYDMVEQERIPYRKVGGRSLFDVDEVIEWTKRRD